MRREFPTKKNHQSLQVFFHGLMAHEDTIIVTLRFKPHFGRFQIVFGAFDPVLHFLTHAGTLRFVVPQVVHKIENWYSQIGICGTLKEFDFLRMP